MKTRYLLALSAFLLSLHSPVLIAQSGPKSSPDSAATADKTYDSRYGSGWLGLSLRPLSSSLAAQLSDLLPTGQGLLVWRVATDSPAAQAGIQRYDILLQYDNQKLFSPGQLSQLVAASRPDQPVTLQLLRRAQLQDIELRLNGASDRYRQMPAPISPYPYTPLSPPAPFAPGFQQQPPNALAWDSFESVEVKTLADGRYHAKVSFKGRDNHIQTFTFEGPREEIIRQINQQSELPGDKRKALLNALNMRVDFSRPNFYSPFMQGNPFDHPFFQNSPFDGPFFQNGYSGGAPAQQGSPWPWQQGR